MTKNRINVINCKRNLIFGRDNMKKIRVIFICSLLALVMSTITLYAVTIDESTTNISTYTEVYSGKASECTILGHRYKTNITITNKYKYSLYMTCMAREYKYDEGWTSNVKEKVGIVSPNGYHGVILDKPSSIKGYYFHVAKCYENVHSGQVYDTYHYTAIHR